MKEPLISVIVPIYDIERYIGLCIESIINQTYQNLEIILVDDGGKDRCPEICDLYAKKDNRIRVIHKTNGGLVSARKAGIRQSNGEYVSYVDGDDWIAPSFIDELYTTARESGADMVCAGQTRDLFSKSESFCNALPSGIYSGEKLIELWKTMISYGRFYKPGISTYVWNKMFKRRVLFEPQCNVDDRISIGEDGAVTYPALLKCRTVAVIESVAYHYRQREDSMLKQSASYADEAQKLKYLYEYMDRWAGHTDFDLNINRQVIDYVFSIALMRSGGRLPTDEFYAFGISYYGKNVVIYSAGTFGQQLVNRLTETQYCKVVGWIDDDYWEYRRCCLDVDPVDSIVNLEFDYILIATVDLNLAEKAVERISKFHVARNKILTVNDPGEKKRILDQFLDVEAIRLDELKYKRRISSHA